MFIKSILKGLVVAVALTSTAQAADLASARGCVNGVKTVDGKTQYDSVGKPLACGGPVVPMVSDAGIDPLLLVAGGALVVGGGIALIVAANHHSNTPVPASR